MDYLMIEQNNQIQKSMKIANKKGMNTKDYEYFQTFKEKSFGGHKKIPTTVDWNKSGTMLASAENGIRIWSYDDVNGLEKINDIKGHDSLIDVLKFSTENMLGSLSREAIKFWDTREPLVRPAKVEKKNKSDFLTFDWNSTQPTYIVLTKENSLTLYDLRKNNTPIKSIKPAYQLTQMIWDRGDNLLICGGGDSTSGLLYFYTKSLQPIPQIFNIHSARVNSLCVSLDNRYLATTGEDSLVQIHNLPDITCERAYSLSDTNYIRGSFSYNGMYLAVGSEDSVIDIYNVSKGGYSYQIKCTIKQQSLAWHPAKMILCYIDDEEKRKPVDKGEQSFIKLFNP